MSNAYRISESEARPWGEWTVVAAGQCFAVKRIIVKSGARLSLQRHRWRDEHWVVVSGIADVVLNGHVQGLKENESIFIPAGSVHRLGNSGPGDLVVIEIQYGRRLDENDIERLEDAYGRA